MADKYWNKADNSLPPANVCAPKLHCQELSLNMEIVNFMRSLEHTVFSLWQVSFVAD